MKVLHFILGKADKSRPNGVNQVIAGLVKGLIYHGSDVRVIGKAETVQHEGVVIQRDGFEVIAYSKNKIELVRVLQNSIRWADVVHIHGLYNIWNILVAILCKIGGKPYILTLHDGLSSVRLRNRRRFLKYLYNLFVQRRHVISAAAIHVLTEEESTDLVNFAGNTTFFLIHNGVDLDDYPSGLIKKPSLPKRKLRIGYLGRISTEKNIHNLVKAFCMSGLSSTSELVLAGPHSKYLDDLLSKYSQASIIWVGAKYGAEKIEYLQSLDLFVHPAYCDVFSIGAMEVLALGIPLLITRTSNAAYFFDRNAFYMCEPTAQGLCKGLESAVSTSEKWGEYSDAGRRLVEETFNWNIAARKMNKAYKEIVGTFD